jgi:acetyl esterase/lipase
MKLWNFPSGLCAGFMLFSLSLLAASIASGKANYPPEIKGAGIEVYKSVDGCDLRLWIFKPDGLSEENPVPAIIFFFGGGWNGGSPQQFNGQALHLRQRGMVAILADYRVRSRNGVTARYCVEDAKSAVRWVRANANRLGIDPDRIAAGGGSAGGHLAASTATLPLFDNPREDLSVSSKPNALVLFNPVAVTGPVEGIEELEIFMQKHNPGRLGADPASMSPYHQLGADLPPTLIFHGTADKTVPHVAAEIFTKKAVSLGARCELVSYEGAGHGFFNPGRDGNKPFRDTVARMDAFLVSLGYLDPVK